MDTDSLLLIVFVAFAVLAVVAFRSAIWRALEGLVDEFNHRGGPPPMHPLPSNDAALLRGRLPL